MSDISLKLTAEKLGKDLEDISGRVEEELNQAVRDLSQAAYASMVAQIQQTKMDPNNRADLLRGLKFDDLGDNSYLIYLEGNWANMLEGGFPPYDMKQTLLSSNKRVAVGQRAGEPWVRTSKQGKKYAAVPFDVKKTSAGMSGDLSADLKQMFAKNRQGKEQRLTKVFKDELGNPLSGKVATASHESNPFLQRVAKFQKVYESGRTSSIYMTWRMVHEDSPGWQHPGFEGHNFFEETERQIESELENILQTLL